MKILSTVDDWLMSIDGKWLRYSDYTVIVKFMNDDCA